MARFSALSLLLLASSGLVGAYRPALRTRNLQAATDNTTTAATTPPAADNSTTPAAAPANNTTTTTPDNNSTTTSKGDLPACRESFPRGEPLKFVNSSSSGGAQPTDPTTFFEGHKESPSLKHEVAKLATCLIDQNQCHESVAKVDTLTGALASVTQELFNAALANSSSSHPDGTAVKQASNPPAIAVSPSTAPADNTTTTPTPHAANTTTATHPDNTTTPHAANTTTTTHHDNTTTTISHANNSTTKPAVHDNTTAATHPDNNTTTTSTTPNTTTSTTTPTANTTTTTPNTTTTAAPTDPAAIANSLATAPQLKAVLDEHASCVAGQPGGQEAFLRHYASYIRDVVHGNTTSTSNTTAPAS